MAMTRPRHLLLPLTLLIGVPASFALYALARSVPLLLLIHWAAFRADAAALIWLGGLLGVIQLTDAAVGLQAGKPSAIWGPLGAGVVQLTVVLLAVLFGV